MTFWGVGLLIVLIVAAGSGLLRLLACRPESRLHRLGVSIALGFCVVSIVGYVPLVLWGTVHFVPILVALAAFSGVEVVARWRERGSERPPIEWASIGLLCLVLLPAVVANSRPFRGYDAKAIFGLKGKALLYERNLEGPVFQDVDIVHYHPDYPLGIPLHVALAAWVSEGDPVDPEGLQPASSAEEWIHRHDAVDAYGPLAQLWVLGLLCLLLGCIRPFVRSPWVTAAIVGVTLPPVVLVASLLQTPWIMNWRSLCGGDRPLALCLGVVGLGVLKAGTSDWRGWIRVAGVVALGACTTKNEASVAIVSLGLACACIGPRFLRIRRVAYLGVALVLGKLMVGTVKARTAGAPYDEDFLRALREADPTLWLERIPRLASAAIPTLRMGTALSMWILFFFVAVPWVWGRRRSAGVLALWVFFHLGVTLGVLLVTPNQAVWQTNTAFNRLSFQIGAPAGLLIAASLAWTWSRFVDPRRQSGEDGDPLGWDVESSPSPHPQGSPTPPSSLRP